MFRHPSELEAHVRYQSERLASDWERCSQIDRADAEAPRLLSQIRRRLGVGLMRVGAAIAGVEARRDLPTPPAWPEFANR